MPASTTAEARAEIEKVGQFIGFDHNLTPDQRKMPREVRRLAFQRMPETCPLVRVILDACGRRLQQDLGVPEHDWAAIDVALSLAFQRIRDEVTQPFRTEQMRLLLSLQGKTDDEIVRNRREAD